MQAALGGMVGAGVGIGLGTGTAVGQPLLELVFGLIGGIALDLAMRKRTTDTYWLVYLEIEFHHLEDNS